MYLLYTTSFVTLEEVRNYKSLASYKYFTAGWVLDISWRNYVDSDCTLVTGKVRHSYSSKTPLRPWVIVRSNGSVVSGHCTCMAGQGETCSHVGALLYWMEARVRIRENTPCTSRENKWLMPSAVKDIPYLMLKDIDFTSAEKKMKCDPPKDENTTATFTTTTMPPTARELSDFFDEIATSKPVILSITEPYSDGFAQSSEQMPQALPTLYDPKHLQLDYLQLVHLSREHIPKTLSLTQQEHLEELTHSQSKSKLWFKYQAGRITGSRVYQVTKTDAHKPALSLLNSVCYPETCQFKSAATNYGCRHEKDALEAYKLQLQSGAHDQPMVTPCGFVVSVDKPFIEASPDAFVQCKCCGPGVVEVKCPFCIQSTSLDSDLPNFCLTRSQDGCLHLKRDHPYYYQCQLQLYVSQRAYCDFVVWTEADVHVERITEDRPFLEVVIPVAEKFFKLCVLPELLGKWFTRTHGCSVPRDIGEAETEEDNGSWCYCKQPKGGDMVCCESKGCNIKWFHLECLQMTESPRGKWVCPTCHATAKRGQKRKHK